MEFEDIVKKLYGEDGLFNFNKAKFNGDYKIPVNTNVTWDDLIEFWNRGVENGLSGNKKE